MKTLKYFALFCLLACFVACSSDDDKGGDSIGGKGSGSFKYDGKTYTLKTGFIDNEGNDWSDDNSTEFYFDFFTTEIIIDPTSQMVMPKDNKFSALSFNLFSSDGDKPKVGTYDFNDYYNVKNTFDEADAIINIKWNSDNVDEDGDIIGDFDEIVYATGGTIKVKKSGSKYDMEFEFMMNNNKTLKGSYNGELMDSPEDDDYLRPSGQSFSQKIKSIIKNSK